MKFLTTVLIALAFLAFLGAPSASPADYLEEDFKIWFPTGWEHISANSETWYRGYTWPKTDLCYAELEYDDTGVIDEWMITPTIDLSAASSSLELNFWFRACYAYQVDPVDDGDMFVRVSTDGGASWSTPVWTENDYGVFEDYEWTEETLDFSAYAGESDFKMAFGFAGDICWQVGFDEIILTDGPDPLDHDVAAVGILTPLSVGDVGVLVTPEATFANMGGNTETFIANMTISLDSIDVYSEDVQVLNLAGHGTTFDVTFPDFTPVDEGIHEVTINAILAGDQFATNDLAVDEYDTTPIQGYFVDFEKGDGGFTFTNDWQYGDPTVENAYSGYNLFGTKLHGVYSMGPKGSDLISPEIDVASNPVLTFYHSYSAEYRFDGGNVKISTDNGNTWELITPEGGYDHPISNLQGNPIGNEMAFTGHHPDWQQETFDLSAYGNQTIRIKFVFGADNSWIYGNGWYVDNIHITDSPQLTINSETLPVTGGTINFTLDGGAANKYRMYLLLGSLSGSNPGTPLPNGGKTLPIYWDSFTDFVLGRLNTPLFTDFLAPLSRTGVGTAQFNAPTLNPSKIGKVMTYAFCLEGNPDWDFASNAVSVEIVP